MTIISERLQHLRLTHGYTQTELARRQPQRSIFLTAHL